MRAPAFWAVLAFGTGVVLADLLPLPVFLLLALLFGLVALGIILRERQSWGVSVVLLLALLLAGSFRYELSTSSLPWNHISNFLNLDEKIGLLGKVVQDPDVREDRTYLSVACQELFWRGEDLKVCGKVLLKIKQPTSKFGYGDGIWFKGYLNAPFGQRNPGAFDYRRYLYTKGISGISTVAGSGEVTIVEPGGNFVMTRIISPARRHLLRHFENSFASPYSDFLSGFVLGERRGMPQDLQDKFRETGTLHLLAVSGGNLGLVMALFYFLVGLFSPPGWLRFILLAGVIVFFSLLTNLQPSVIRAAVMGILVLFALQTQRDISFLNLVSLAALLILLWNPQALFDVSFQLSFASVASIGILVPQLEELFFRVFKKKRRTIYRFLILPFLVSTSAILGVAPLSVYYFDSFSPVAFISNLVIVPLAGLILVLATASSLAALILKPLADLLVSANWLLLKGVMASLDFFSRFGFSLVNVPHPPLWVFWLYPFMLLALLFSFTHRRAKYALAGLGAMALGLGIVSLVQARIDASLKITILDSAPATIILCQLPSGGNLLFLREPQAPDFDYIEKTLLPCLFEKGIGRLDHLVLLASGYRGGAILSQLSGELSLGAVHLSSPESDSTVVKEEGVPPFSHKPLELKGVKLWQVYIDNKKEAVGSVFEFDDLTLVEVNQKECLEGKDWQKPKGAVWCLDYRLFTGVTAPLWQTEEEKKIIVSGWDFKTNRTVERNISTSLPDGKYLWTKKTGGVEIRFQREQAEFKTTLKEK